MTGIDFMRKGTLGIKWVEPIVKKNNSSDCIVVIPVYKQVEKLSKFEIKSIERTIEVLGKKYEIMLLCGKSFDVEAYSKRFEYDFSYMKCSDEYFKSQKSYSDLCEKFEFYNALSDYEYILICQPDAWVFEDNLEYFIKLGYDYIGSVHMLRSNGAGGRVGNGGFSLRKVKKFADVCKETNFDEFPFSVFEDCTFTIRLKNKFNIAPVSVGFEFGWQEQPQAAYEKTKKLPMGCHNPMKNNWNFWRNYIVIADEDFDKNKMASLTGVDNVSIKQKYTNSNIIKKKPNIERPI